MLKETEKAELLNVARDAITQYVKNGTIIRLPNNVSEGLREKRGAFVTLKKQGVLRGCIGTFFAHDDLIHTVAEMARSAATADPRFDPVVPEEIDELTIEISALTPLTEIDDPSVIEVGRHGIYLTRGLNRGVLLPQVAVEYGWDREQFLDETCWKAGMDKGCWHDPRTRIEIFEAEIFSE